jgi:hypothetical protein
MISHRVTRRPEKLATLVAGLKHRWMVPFRAFESFGSGSLTGSATGASSKSSSFGSFWVLIGVIFYFSESGDRIKQRHYQAWQVINTARGKGGSGGRIEALQELNEDKIQLVGVDVSSAFLQGVHLEHANLLRAHLSAADLRGSDFRFADLTFADLHAANFRGSDLENASFSNADLKDADLVGVNLAGANLDRVDLTAADLRSANLKDVQWKQIRSIKTANIAGAKTAPDGFIQWALQNDAIDSPSADE